MNRQGRCQDCNSTLGECHDSGGIGEFVLFNITGLISFLAWHPENPLIYKTIICVGMLKLCIFFELWLFQTSSDRLRFRNKNKSHLQSGLMLSQCMEIACNRAVIMNITRKNSNTQTRKYWNTASSRSNDSSLEMEMVPNLILSSSKKMSKPITSTHFAITRSIWTPYYSNY